MKAIVAVLALVAAAYGGVIAPTTLVRTPSLDSAVIQSDRLGGNFAYSSVEGHAYAAVSPVVQNVISPVGVSYAATPIISQVGVPIFGHGLVAPGAVFAPSAPAVIAPVAPGIIAPGVIPLGPIEPAKEGEAIEKPADGAAIEAQPAPAIPLPEAPVDVSAEPQAPQEIPQSDDAVTIDSA